MKINTLRIQRLAAMMNVSTDNRGRKQFAGVMQRWDGKYKVGTRGRIQRDHNLRVVMAQGKRDRRNLKRLATWVGISGSNPHLPIIVTKLKPIVSRFDRYNRRVYG